MQWANKKWHKVEGGRKNALKKFILLWILFRLSKFIVTKWIRNFVGGHIRFDWDVWAKQVVQFVGNNQQWHIQKLAYLLSHRMNGAEGRRRRMKKRLSQIETVYKSKLIGTEGWGKQPARLKLYRIEREKREEEEEVKVKNDKTSL